MSSESINLPLSAQRARSRGSAPTVGGGYQILQTVLYVAGAVLLPTGLVVIVLGWYGAARTAYQYDQISYLVSGGLLGLGLTFCGGFLYFGAWLARIAADQRESNKRLSDTLLILADVVSTSAAASSRPESAADVLVLAGDNGNLIHRRDCSLIAGRDDLEPVGGRTAGKTLCRVCGGAA